MAPTADPSDVVGRVRRDVGRNLLRARNGVKYVTGIDRPKVGQTPKDTVWRREKAQLWHYRSDDVTTGTPVLIVMSLISRSYILDLHPGASFVAALRDAGLDVYLLDWGIPDESDAANSLSTYVDELLPDAVEAVLDDSGAGSVNLIGYCYGGILALLLGAAYPQLPVASTVTMATPVDFGELGMLGRMFDEGRLDPDTVVDDTGNVPPEVMRNAFRVLRPTAEISQYAVLWEKLWDDKQMEAYQVMGQWTRDHIPFPGQCFQDTVAVMREQGLVNDRALVGGRRVRLSDFRWPLLNVVAQKDHIVPCGAALPVADLVGSQESETLELPAGHVGLVMGKSAAKTTLPGIVDWLRRHSDARDDDETAERAAAEAVGAGEARS
jgi:polyhydroxyalkanoate synthase subunit PhaC